MSVETLNTHKQILVVAGAGTGKTYTVVEKISYILEKKLLAYENIVATTFTNKAANELRERLIQKFGKEAARINIGTFHSLSLEILQESGAIDPKTVILSAEAQLKLVESILEKEKTFQTKASKMVDKIQRAKEGLENLTTSSENRLLSIYNSHLRNNNMVDFSDLIKMTIELWDNNPEILAKYREKFRFIAVDEYQDLSNSQFLWIKKVSSDWLVCVGDMNQAIYGFRGANCEYIMNFQKFFPEAAIIKLERNYRSGKEIIKAANNLIKHNKNRLDTTLYTENEFESTIEVKNFPSARLEASYIAKKISNFGNLGEVAILVRNRSQMMHIAEALSAAGIPIDATGIVERAEAKNLKAHMMLVIDPNNIEAFERAILATKNGIGATTVEKIIQSFRNGDAHTLLETVTLFASKIKQGDALTSFVEVIKKASRMHSLNQVANFLLTNCDYTAKLDDARKGNLERWIELLPNLTLHEYFAPVRKGGVNLMTIHASKGLEFGYVFLPCWEDGVLPHHGAVGAEIEEERRLAYVGLTRAKRGVLVSNSTTKLINNKMYHVEPSIFIAELGIKTYEALLKSGEIVFHKNHGKGTVLECGERAAMVKFFSGAKLIGLNDLSKF